jgi:hypothetical protein
VTYLLEKEKVLLAIFVEKYKVKPGGEFLYPYPGRFLVFLLIFMFMKKVSEFLNFKH